MSQAMQRIILKLSGEALSEPGTPFCHQRFQAAAQMLSDIRQTGVQLAVVIGGGNVWRGRRGAAMEMGTVAADQMGMLATVQNCLYMRDTLAHMGLDAVVMTGVDMPRFTTPYNTVEANERLNAGQIVLFGGGIGCPCFSTDTTVVLRAIELECDAIFMAKNIVGVYTADPHTNANAQLIPELSYDEAARRDLKVMDAAAFILLRENRFPLVRVFALEPPQNVLKVLDGDSMGTVLHP